MQPVKRPYVFVRDHINIDHSSVVWESATVCLPNPCFFSFWLFSGFRKCSSFSVCNLICFSAPYSFRLLCFVSDYEQNHSPIRIYVVSFLTLTRASFCFPLFWNYSWFIWYIWFRCDISVLYKHVGWSFSTNVLYQSVLYRLNFCYINWNTVIFLMCCIIVLTILFLISGNMCLSLSH